MLLGAGVVTLVAGYFAPSLHYEDDFRKMRPPGSEGVAVQNEVARTFGSGFESMMLVIHAADEVELLDRVHRAEAGARPLVEEGILRGTDSLASLIPSRQDQQGAIAWLEDNREILDGDRLWRVFADAAGREGLRATAFEDGLRLLAEAAWLAER